MKTYLGVGVVSAVCMLMLVSAAGATTIPSSIAGLDVWLDGADGATLFQDAGGAVLAGVAGDPVALWKDKSGNHNDAAISGLGAAPTYASSAIGGKSAVAFNGSQVLSNGGYAWSTAVDVFAVVSANSWSSANGYTYIVSSGPLYYAGITLTGGAYDGWGANELLAFGNDWPSPATPRVSAPYGTMTNGQAAIFGVTLSSSAAQIVLDGTTLSPTSHGVGNALTAKTGYTVGANPAGGQNWQGNIAELLIFNRTLSPSESNSVGYYLQEKYGLAGSYVPEPTSITLLVTGLIGLLAYAWRKRT